ncbi:hypothetical protein ACSFBF_23840 [Variovorax sp. ZT5P49]|uniref:hypothetical protein n=1 Tax=Variovorax sp. ZT5P49 TaxID=3443733 RepID=UPI003F448CEE
MPQRHPSIDPIAQPDDETLPTEWTSRAPQATERAPKSAADWAAWLVALAVLVFMAVFGFQAMTWALAGGWQWLWLAVGLPFFGVFSVSTVLLIVTRLRERRRVRVALANMSLERGEGFRIGEPFELRLRATVPVAQEGERTVAPKRIGMRLMRGAFIRAGSPVNECCDEAVASREDARDGRLLYTCELRAGSEHGGTAQWFVELHDMADDGASILVAPLRLLPAR